MDTGLLITVVFAVAIAAAFLAWKLSTGHDAQHGGKSRAESELLRMNLGDKNKVERLIQYEIRKAPGISRAEAARAAVESMRHDNR